MKITNFLIQNLNESSNSKFLEIINFLIDDEVEAIEGYENAIDSLSKVLTEDKYNKVINVLNHIKDEEQEHINELKELINQI